MVRINVKPLSVNRCWQGRRFKTPEYGVYEKMVIHMLPKLEIPPGRLFLRLTVGFSSKASDIDNSIKPLLDIFQKKYLFDDKRIYRLEVEKRDVRKGEEFIEFTFQSLDFLPESQLSTV